jgi:hypothetical protein
MCVHEAIVMFGLVGLAYFGPTFDNIAPLHQDAVICEKAFKWHGVSAVGQM